MAKPPSRKQRRREERQSKKARNALHFSKKAVHGTEAKGHRGGVGRAPKPFDKHISDVVRSRKHGSHGKGFTRPQRNENPVADTEREDREISKMEKLLGLKKMKKLPTTFESEGLTYLLDVLDKGEKGDFEDITEDEMEGSSGSDSAPEEFETLTRSSRTKRNASATTRQALDVTGQGKGVLCQKKDLSSSSGDLRPSKRVQFSMDGRMNLKDEEDQHAAAKDEEGDDDDDGGDDDDDDGAGMEDEEERDEGSDEEEMEEEESDGMEGWEDESDGEDLEEGVGEELEEGDGEELEEGVGEELEEGVGEELEEGDGEELEEGVGEELEEGVGEEELEVEGVGEELEVEGDGGMGEEDRGKRARGVAEGEGSEGEGRAQEDEGGGDEGKAREPAECRYIPPHLRQKDKSKQLGKLKKRVQGLLNRLSESNMQSISTQLEQLYHENSRNDMNTVVTEVLLKACVTPAMLSDRFMLEHCMLLTLLHCHMGSEVGAYFVQALAKKLDELLKMPPNYGAGKECNCAIALFAHLYNFKVIHCALIYDIIRRLVSTFTEKDVELLVLLLKNTGMEIRRDDATALKDITVQIQTKAAATSAFTDSSRSKFMLETIAAIKSNNPRKIPQYDPSLLDHMRKHLRGLVRTSGKEDEGQLKITFQDLLEANEKGRWWIVGSAWSGREARASNAASSEGGSEAWVLDLARKQRMNTDVRKNIFCILMTSEDYIDAFEKLLKLHLNDVQEREIVHVLVDCCLQERAFNPYYAFLGQKLCKFKRSHKVTFQFSMWDRIKALETMSPIRQANLWKLISHLVATKALSLALLKVVEFTELSSNGTKFLKNLLKSLLCDYPCELTRCIFSHLSTQPNLKQLKEQIIIFMKCFLRSDEDKVVTERIRMVEEGLRTNS
ncbi:hypothetical protein EMCRGX_G020220 [Ephydatia muelleri]